jgi:hypothetical protein
MPVFPRGEDAAAALRTWICEDIKEAPNRIFELGKFLFGVSGGSIGVFVSISTFEKVAWAAIEWTSLGAFVVSCAVALFLCIPGVKKLSAQFDIAAAHNRMVTTAAWCIYGWGFVWTLGVILAGFGLLTGERVLETEILSAT